MKYVPACYILAHVAKDRRRVDNVTDAFTGLTMEHHQEEAEESGCMPCSARHPRAVVHCCASGRWMPVVLLDMLKGRFRNVTEKMRV